MVYPATTLYAGDCHSCVQGHLARPNLALPHQLTRSRSGEEGTLHYRVFLTKLGTSEDAVSPWHSIPLYNIDGSVNFICEIPKNTRAKFEVATTEVHNPIKQDSKNGKPRYYAMNILWNYGMLPQTWEDPTHASADCGGAFGDNDPVDIVEIGDRTYHTGDVVAVKPIAALAMIDDGELDWKVVAISTKDPRAALCNDVADVETHFPGVLSEIREWFRNYKIPDGKKANVFALEEKFMPAGYTKAVIAQTHGFWAHLVHARRTGTCESGSAALKLAVEGAPPPFVDPCPAHRSLHAPATPPNRVASSMPKHVHPSSNSILDVQRVFDAEAGASDDGSDEGDKSSPLGAAAGRAQSFMNGVVRAGIQCAQSLGKDWGSLKRKPSRELLSWSSSASDEGSNARTDDLKNKSSADCVVVIS